MKTAAILRQMPVAASSRLLGQIAAPLPRSQPVSTARQISEPDSQPAAPAPVPEAPPAMTEAQIEQCSLALAQRLMQTEAESLRKAAREEGLRLGREEGLREAQTQIAEQLAAQQTRFLAVTDALVEALSRESSATEDTAVELAMAALARLLGEAPDASRVSALVRQAGLQLRDPSQLRVRLAPADLALLKEAGIDPAALAPQVADVQWVADPAIRGGCVLQTAAGNLDARLQQQLAVLADALLQVYHAQGARV